MTALVEQVPCVVTVHMKNMRGKDDNGHRLAKSFNWSYTKRLNLQEFFTSVEYGDLGEIEFDIDSSLGNEHYKLKPTGRYVNNCGNKQMTFDIIVK